MTQRLERIGQRIKQAREASGISQTGLGKALSVSQSAVSLYERGEREMTIDQLFAIAAALSISVASLLGLPTSLSEDEDALLAAYRAIPRDDLRAIMLETLKLAGRSR